MTPTETLKTKSEVLKTALAELNLFLTDVPDMAKTSEPVLFQVCSLKLATQGVDFFLPGAPLDCGSLSLRCCLCLVH